MALWFFWASEQWKLWWDCPVVQVCPSLHCSPSMTIMNPALWDKTRKFENYLKLCTTYFNAITFSYLIFVIWAASWQNQQNECVPSEDSDQPGHLPSLITVFTVRMKKTWVLSYPISAQRRLIRLGGCPGWSESSLGAHSFCWFCHVAAHFAQWAALGWWIGPKVWNVKKGCLTVLDAKLPSLHNVEQWLQ